MVEQSSSVRQCSYCQKLKAFVLTDFRLKDGSKVYVNHCGKRWSGKRCPDCERKRVKQSLRCDPFEKAHILNQLEKDGYQVIDKRLPFKVKNRLGEYLTVGIRRAITENGKILVEEEIAENADLYILLFESIRIVERHKLENMKEKLIVSHQKTDSPGITQIC